MKYSVGAYELSEYINYKYFDVSYNVRLCNTLAGMNSELVNIRVHHGNGFINYCDSGVDLSQFQYVDTTVSNPLHMRHGNMLDWMHNFLQVDPSHWRIKVSGVVPRQREHG